MSAPKLNPVEKARENAGLLRARYDASKDRLHALAGADCVDCFEARMACWTMSMNMRRDDLEAFLSEGRHRNIYMKTADEVRDYALMFGGKDGVPNLDEALEKDLKSWYLKRMAYRQTVEDEDRLKYGAVCAEGNGLDYYGPFVVFLSRSAVDAFAAMFVLKMDSLNYVLPDNSFDTASYLADLAIRENVVELAVVKHESELAVGCDEAMQAHCFARSADDRCYLEIQVYDEIMIPAVEEVRWSKTLDDDMKGIAKRKLNGMLDFRKEKDELDWLIYGKYKQIHEKMRNLGVERKIVEP